MMTPTTKRELREAVEAAQRGHREGRTYPVTYHPTALRALADHSDWHRLSWSDRAMLRALADVLEEAGE